MPDSFDVQFKLFPPDLQMKLWLLGLDANTSKVNIAYQPGKFRASLGYRYGGNFEAALSLKPFSASLGVNPANSNVSVSAGYTFRGFRFDSSASLSRRTVGVGLNYGRQLLPFPSELQSVFNAAGTGLAGIARDISAAPTNPLEWYKLHSNDVSAISRAVDLGKNIADRSKDTGRVGFGVRLSYTPQSGFLIYSSAGFWF